MHILVGLVSYCLRGSGNGACIQYVTVYSCNWDDGDLVSPPSLSPSLQPRLLQKPHRFLRDPLLRSDPARDGGLDHAVHNRIRPDVRLRLPAGVEEEEEGGGARGGEESSLASWKGSLDGWPSPLPSPRKPLPTPGVHIRAMLFSGALAFFGPSLPHRSNDFGKKKEKKISQDSHAVTGKHHTDTPPFSLPRPHHHHLYYYYYYYYYSTASDFITVPPLLSDPSTSSLLPSPLDGALLPGTNGEERGRRTRGFPK